MLIVLKSASENGALRKCFNIGYEAAVSFSFVNKVVFFFFLKLISSNFMK